MLAELDRLATLNRRCHRCCCSCILLPLAPMLTCAMSWRPWMRRCACVGRCQQRASSRPDRCCCCFSCMIAAQSIQSVKLRLAPIQCNAVTYCLENESRALGKSSADDHTVKNKALVQINLQERNYLISETHCTTGSGVANGLRRSPWFDYLQLYGIGVENLQWWCDLLTYMPPNCQFCSSTRNAASRRF